MLTADPLPKSLRRFPCLDAEYGFSRFAGFDLMRTVRVLHLYPEASRAWAGSAGERVRSLTSGVCWASDASALTNHA